LLESFELADPALSRLVGRFGYDPQSVGRRRLHTKQIHSAGENGIVVDLLLVCIVLQIHHRPIDRDQKLHDVLGLFRVGHL
jgi:hypothetical protein